MPEDRSPDSVILLIAPTLGIATALAQRFEGLLGVRVIHDRRQPWPQAERRRRLLSPDVERRSGERRGTWRFSFDGALVEGGE
jgi:hypothetical protein